MPGRHVIIAVNRLHVGKNVRGASIHGGLTLHSKNLKPFDTEAEAQTYLEERFLRSGYIGLSDTMPEFLQWTFRILPEDEGRERTRTGNGAEQMPKRKFEAKDHYSPQDLALLFGTSTKYVHTKMDNGTIPSYRLPGSKFRRMDHAQLLDWLADARQKDAFPEALKTLADAVREKESREQPLFPVL